MKKILQILILTVICSNYYSVKSQTNVNKEIIFSPLTKPGKNNLINKLQVYVCADTLQKQSENGIQFSIRIKNDSNVNISINNPLDVFTPDLRDDSNRYAMIKYIPKTYINLDSHSKYTFNAFNVTDVKCNNHTVWEDLKKTNVITIPANGVYEIFLSITKVDPIESSGEILVPGGHRYNLTILLSLGEFMKKEYKGFEFKNIYINYECI